MKDLVNYVKEPETQLETVVFVVQAIKQFCFGFESMNEAADDFAHGSAGKAFFLTAIYHHIAVFYLLDRKKDAPMGGAFYPVLSEHGLESLLDPVMRVLEEPLGETTLGEVIRAFRNKVIVHTKYRDDDLDRIYDLVDISEPAVQARFQDLLVRLYAETRLLAVELAKSTGRPLADFGIAELPS